MWLESSTVKSISFSKKFAAIAEIEFFSLGLFLLRHPVYTEQADILETVLDFT